MPRPGFDAVVGGYTIVGDDDAEPESRADHRD